MIKVTTANGCAWRAVYVYVDDRKVAHLGVDPNHGVTPQMFGGLLGRDFRFGLPRVPWRSQSSDIYLRAYKASQAFWFGVDGRFGWGTKRS